ncbi:MAG TPA: IS1380 family transposase [Drouetiella sp.]
MNKSKTKLCCAQGYMQLDLGLSKLIEAKFDGDCISSDGGLSLLRKADDRLEITKLAAWCLRDERRPDLIKHKVQDLFRQRIFAIAAGYEDCNDAQFLKNDGMHKLMVGQFPNSNRTIASQPTLSRWENSVDETALKALQRLLVHTYIRRQKRRPQSIKLAMDTTCDLVHGYQQLSFYNAFYEDYCFTPLFIFDEAGFPLAALLRHGNAAPAEYGLRMVREVVTELRRQWPDVPIELSADAGFCVPELYEYCEEQSITYFIGIKSNSVFKYKTEPTVRACKADFDEFGRPTASVQKYGYYDSKAKKIAWRQKEERIRFSTKAEGRMQEHFEDELLVRKFYEFSYQSREWSRERRIIARCDYSAQGPDIRYIITNSKSANPKRLYEQKYCRRARCENWIKDLKLYLKSDRTSCQEFSANQFRLLLHTFAYILLWEVKQRAGLRDLTMHSVQLLLIKVGVLIRENARRVTFHFASNFAMRREFARAWRHL